jgi:hypothetical protein
MGNHAILLMKQGRFCAISVKAKVMIFTMHYFVVISM